MLEGLGSTPSALYFLWNFSLKPPIFLFFSLFIFMPFFSFFFSSRFFKKIIDQAWLYPPQAWQSSVPLLFLFVFSLNLTIFLQCFRCIFRCLIWFLSPLGEASLKDVGPGKRNKQSLKKMKQKTNLGKITAGVRQSLQKPLQFPYAF